MLSPSFPPAICKTTRIVPSLPVTFCVHASAAIASSAKNVFSRKTGSVQVAAAPSIEVRRNCRRVCRVICIDSLGQLKLRSAHHQMNKFAHGLLAGVRFARFQILHKSVCLFFRSAILKKPRAQKIDEFPWFLTQFGRREFANVDRVAPSLLGQCSGTAKTKIAGLAAPRTARRQHYVTV